MPYCLKCGAKVKNFDNYCMKCGEPRKMPQIDSRNAPTAAQVDMIVNRLATDEAFRIEYVENHTCRTNVNSDDMLVGMLRSDPDFRKSFVYGYVSDEYIEKTQCSELPLDWRLWPNLILVENSFPAEMADSIAAFIKRTENAEGIIDDYDIGLISTDSSRSWSVLREARHVLFFEDNFEDDIGEIFMLNKICQEELDYLSKARMSNIDEYNKLHPEKHIMRHFLFIDDYDMCIQKANDNRIQQVILPNLVTYASRLGFYIILGSKAGSRALGSLKSLFAVKSSSEFVQMCKGEYSPDSSSITPVTGYDFEQMCANLLLKKKYQKVEVTKKSGDQGIDILAEKDGVKFAIQCKYYNSPVGNNAIQEAFAGKSFYGCHVAVVMTNSTFSDAARQLANQLGVVLWDGKK